MKRAGILLVLSGLLVACQDSDLTEPASPGIEPGSPAFHAVQHGDHFFFLPPLAKPDRNGEFNPNRPTRVEICLWSTTPAGCSGAPVQRFDPAEIAVLEEEEQYQVDWKLRSSGALAEGLYAVQVWTDDHLLGRALIAIGDNARAARDIARGHDALPLTRNRTLPIKYRVELGASCEDPDHCAEFLVSDDGGTFTTEDEQAGVAIPSGALPPGVEDVTLIIEELDVPPSQCLGGTGNLVVTGSCVRFDTEPELDDGFAEDVVVGICFDPQAVVDAGLDPAHFLIHRFDPETGDPTVEALASAAAPFLSCEEDHLHDVLGRADGGAASKLVHAALWGLGRLFGPTPLVATDEGWGGVASRFSNFQWAMPLTLEPASATDQTGTVGQPVPAAPTVRVRTGHYHPGEAPAPVEGQDVTFEFFDVDGSPIGSPVTVQSDAVGLASVGWDLSASVGTQTAVATAFNAGPVTFTADAQPADDGAGTVTDPAGDAPAGEADLKTLRATFANGELTLGARFHANFDPATTYVAFLLDTDQDASTGQAGLTHAGGQDADLMGVDYAIHVTGSTHSGGVVRVLEWNGSYFWIVSTAPIRTVLSDGYEVVVPLSVLGEDDGAMNVKASVTTQTGDWSTSAIWDWVPDLGVSPLPSVPTQ